MSYPQPGPPAPPPATPLVALGDITCTVDEVLTRSGRIPLRDATFTVSDMTYFERVIPTWAIVTGVVVASVTCLLGLLLLLVKEDRRTGWVQVVVTGPTMQHVCAIPVSGEAQYRDLLARLEYARGLTARRS